MNQNKKDKIKQLTNQLRQTTDSLGMPIDPGIFNTVVYLNALNITTAASCEGHLDHGIAAPWVDIRTPNTKQFNELEDRAHSLWKDIQKKREAGNKEEVLLKEYQKIK